MITYEIDQLHIFLLHDADWLVQPFCHIQQGLPVLEVVQQQVPPIDHSILSLARGNQSNCLN